MKNLHRPIPKSKILEELKKTNENNGNKSSMSLFSSQQSITSQTIDCSPNISQRTLAQRKTAATAATTSGTKPATARKSLSKSKAVVEKPKNTIRSMFAKQLEMSQRSEKSQLNGTIDKITTLNINESDVESQSRQESEHNEQTPKRTAASNDGTVEILVSGSLHKRLTRRNSMTLKTPTKLTIESDDTVPATPSSIKKRRCTMFTPSLKLSIEEESMFGDNSNVDATLASSTSSTSTATTASSNKTVIVADKTLNKSVAMDVCNQSKLGKAQSTPSNSKVRQLLNDDLSKSSCESSITDATKFLQPKIRLPLHPRRTTFTARPMDETKLIQPNSSSSSGGGGNSSIISSNTPLSSLTKKRNTMNVNAGTTTTPQTKMVRTVLDLNKSTSCDAILTPTNKIAGKFLFTILAQKKQQQIIQTCVNCTHCRLECIDIYTIVSIIIESAS